VTREIHIRDLAAHVGEELGTSAWLEVDQHRIDAFAEITGDRHWMHVDLERAKREMGGTIAHGLLVVSLLPLLSEGLFSATGYSGGYSYGFDKLRYSNIVRPGQRIRLRQRIKSVTPRPPGQLLVLESIVEIDGEEKPALVADWVSLYFN
jgi:acyl dehydratase